MLSTSRPMVLPSNCSAQMSSGTAGVPGSSPQPRHPASLLQAQLVVREAYQESLTRPRGLFKLT